MSVLVCAPIVSPKGGGENGVCKGHGGYGAGLCGCSDEGRGKGGGRGKIYKCHERSQFHFLCAWWIVRLIDSDFVYLRVLLCVRVCVPSV